MQHISVQLNKNIRKAGIEPQVKGAQVVEHFNKVVEQVLGEKISSKVQAQYVKNKTLTVAVLSSVVGQELKLREKEILDQLNGDAQIPLVERLRFLV